MLSSLRTAIILHAGLTYLYTRSVNVFDAFRPLASIVSIEKLTSIYSLVSSSGTVYVENGCVISAYPLPD